MRSDELMHYGVLGMKWGQHRARKNTAKAKMYRSYAEDYDPKNALYKMSDKSRVKMQKKYDTNMAKASKYQAKADRANAKADRKKALRSTYKSINKSASIGEKLMYNSATRKKASKYVVDNNMSIAEATKRAKGDAKRNTAIMLAAYGAVTLGSIVYDRYR